MVVVAAAAAVSDPHGLGCSPLYEQSLIGTIVPPLQSLLRTVSIRHNIPTYGRQSRLLISFRCSRKAK